ncbi:hypothetical protein VTO42DRAFT_5430 [Malbranchea cinnamomea]
MAMPRIHPLTSFGFARKTMSTQSFCPHSSHVLQPLDLSVFGTLKHYYRSRLSRRGISYRSTIKLLRIQQVTRPSTPPNNLIANALVTIDPLSTPRKLQDIERAIRELDKQGKLDRSERRFFQKTARLVGQLAAQQAGLESTINKLANELQDKKKKRVQVDPNTRFANIQQIKEALDAAAAQEAHLQQRQSEIEAERAAEAALQAGLDARTFEWQAY